jgi:hypothetical protein
MRLRSDGPASPGADERKVGGPGLAFETWVFRARTVSREDMDGPRENWTGWNVGLRPNRASTREVWKTDRTRGQLKTARAFQCGKSYYSERAGGICDVSERVKTRKTREGMCLGNAFNVISALERSYLLKYVPYSVFLFIRSGATEHIRTHPPSDVGLNTHRDVLLLIQNSWSTCGVSASAGASCECPLQKALIPPHPFSYSLPNTAPGMDIPSFSYGGKSLFPRLFRV